MYVPETLPAFYIYNESENSGYDLDVSFKKWRNLKLCESDFMALSDTPTITTEWATFRQSLRDFPNNSNYPTLLPDQNFVPLDPEGN